ncbi:hypothetical protein [Leptonema illini]|uniref:Uncharacterized protein n=1 Tax=Leptonema illini DSM 21528 TaxID=929563 RepID=H2CL88_9LEPT|nr:hypothetical protein [Leptonema illini]EHQ08339.1 hypothetical protein Lepil_3684 [Leptonema illini DSM 21528]
MADTQNPYAPPDREVTPADVIPLHARRGLRWLLISILLLPIAVAFQSHFLPHIILIPYAILLLALLIVLYIMIRRQRVWARNVLVTITLPLALLHFLAFPMFFGAFPIPTLLSTMQIIFQALAAFALMRREANRWMHGPKNPLA